MGADFVRKAVPTFKRSLDRALLRLSTPDLFTSEIAIANRTMAGDVLENADLKEGDALTVEFENYELVGRVGFRTILHFKHPSDEILKAVVNACGVAKGRVEQVYGMAKVVEVSLC